MARFKSKENDDQFTQNLCGGYRVMVDSEILRKHNSRAHKNILTERMLKLILQAR